MLTCIIPTLLTHVILALLTYKRCQRSATIDVIKNNNLHKCLLRDKSWIFVLMNLIISNDTFNYFGGIKHLLFPCGRLRNIVVPVKTQSIWFDACEMNRYFDSSITIILDFTLSSLWVQSHRSSSVIFFPLSFNVTLFEDSIIVEIFSCPLNHVNEFTLLVK